MKHILKAIEETLNMRRIKQFRIFNKDGVELMEDDL